MDGNADIRFTGAGYLLEADEPDEDQYFLWDATYQPATRTCADVSCHLEQTRVTWGTPCRWKGQFECNVCHQF